MLVCIYYTQDSITKALRDLGYIKFDEPFKSLTHQGTNLRTRWTKNE